MAKLKMSGRAQKEAPYDVMRLSITFNTQKQTNQEAIHTVLTQTEEFLKKLSKLNINVEDIELHNTNVHDTYRKEDKFYVASRQIGFKTSFNPSLINTITELLEPYEVGFSSDYELSNENEIKQELIKEAIQDSREKAEFVALQINKTIKDVEEVILTNHYNDIALLRANFAGYENKLDLSNQLKAPTTSLEESVEVVWILE